jgi:glycosyltransferase involved in cell wall biosynthesis|tara:strand:- start:1883 stop:2635 length:753 start_codon:yes stop_codon:yes gene_type:complete
MKFSIITATFNSEKYISTNINSIKNQTYTDYEQIIIDNNSSDKTIQIIKNFKHDIKIFSESDNGIYNAFNKGIKKVSGDIISILNSDDLYSDENVLCEVVKIFKSKNIDILYGDLRYVGKNNINSTKRFWKSNNYKFGSFKLGWSPPHPTLFIKKEIYEKYGLFKEDLGTCADFELMFRFMEQNLLKTFYLNKTLITMRVGGESNSNLSGIMKQNFKIIKVLEINKNLFLLIRFFTYKFFNRLAQLIFLK